MKYVKKLGKSCVFKDRSESKFDYTYANRYSIFRHDISETPDSFFSKSVCVNNITFQ